MKLLSIGQTVKAVRSTATHMNPEPINVGLVGTVRKEIRDASGLYYEVEFPTGVDYVCARCLEVLS